MQTQNAAPFPRELGLVRDLADAMSKLTKAPTVDGTFAAYRGHANAAWDVVPSIFRQTEKLLASEANITRELISRYPNEFQNDQTTFDRLVRMQHFGLPTRLLDVTNNPLVALYFATDISGDAANFDGALVIMRVSDKRKKYFDSDSVSCLTNLSKLSEEEKNSLESTKANTISDLKKIKAADRLYQFIREEKPHFRFRIIKSDLFKPVYVLPKMNNNRIIAQGGTFIAFGLNWKSDTSYERGIFNYFYRIPSLFKPIIREQLKMLGIHSGTIFPEIDRAAAEIVREFAS